jgi:hypothetical protein
MIKVKIEIAAPSLREWLAMTTGKLIAQLRI